MQNWGEGYVTDVEYSDGFYAEQGPAQLALTAMMNSVEPPDIKSGFTYCELGSGLGGTCLILAAVHPEAEFHAIDFHPAHIAQARALAKSAGLRNITFHECSFDDLVRPGGPTLPMFDFITMHGVWSWVSPALQSAILAILNGKLNPGGLVYTSYNAMPAWAAMGPLQRIIKELASARAERSDVALRRALTTLQRLSDAKVIPALYRDGLKKIEDNAVRGHFSYLAHEYLNEHWRPTYHLDVVRAFERSKLAYVGSTDMLKNFTTLMLSQEQLVAMSEVENPALRETLKDFCTEEWFRKDAFVRGKRRIPNDVLLGRISELRLVLLREPPEKIGIARPDGTNWIPDPAVYGPLMQALKQEPRTIGELLSLPELPEGHKVGAPEIAGILIGAEIAAPYFPPPPEAVAAADRMNDLLPAPNALSLFSGATVATPVLASGVTLSPTSYALYRAMRSGAAPDPEALATAFVDRCHSEGRHPVINGEAMEERGEALAAATEDYAARIESVAPIWRSLGMV